MYYDNLNINLKGFDAGDIFHSKVRELSLTLLSLSPSYSRISISIEKNNNNYLCSCKILPMADLFSVVKTARDPSTAFELAYCAMILKLNKWRSSRKDKPDFIFYNKQSISNNNLLNLKGGAA